MLPPRLIRRLVLVPLVIVIAAGLAALTPLVALLSAVFSLVRRRTMPGRVSRSRARPAVKPRSHGSTTGGSASTRGSRRTMP